MMIFSVQELSNGIHANSLNPWIETLGVIFFFLIVFRVFLFFILRDANRALREIEYAKTPHKVEWSEEALAECNDTAELKCSDTEICTCNHCREST